LNLLQGDHPVELDDEFVDRSGLHLDGGPVVGIPLGPQFLGPQTGVERELERLTPADVDQGKSLYRQILPGIIQVPAQTVLALARKSYVPSPGTEASKTKRYGTTKSVA